jgi:DNA-directed RNA polymerase specialized sigma24 family protein
MARTHYSSAKRKTRTLGGRLTSTNDDNERLGKALERRTMEVEDSVARIDNQIYHRELARALPWKTILSGLSRDELQLLRLSVIDEMSSKEVAELLGEDAAKIRYEVNRLMAKIRYRVKTLLKKDETANKLMLTWEQIYAKRDRIAS